MKQFIIRKYRNEWQYGQVGTGEVFGEFKYPESCLTAIQETHPGEDVQITLYAPRPCKPWQVTSA
jgi:hypothetical protein